MKEKYDCFEPPFCQPCEVVFTICPKCGTSYSDKLPCCPECREENRGRVEKA